MNHVNLNQDFNLHEMAKRGPMNAGALREAIAGVPDSAPVVLYSDEEGNQIHHLWAVETGVEDKAVLLRPAGEDLCG